jgi:hypothetical protein
MFRKLTCSLTGLALLVSPLVVSAQTVDTSNLLTEASSCLSPAVGVHPAVTQQACSSFIEILVGIIAELETDHHTAVNPSATIDQSSLTQPSGSFSITGEAYNSSAVIVTLVSASAGGAPYSGGTDWDTIGGYLQGNPTATTNAGNLLYSYTGAVTGPHLFSVSFSIPTGTYTVLVHNSDYNKYALLVTGTLTVGASTSQHYLSASPTLGTAPLPVTFTYNPNIVGGDSIGFGDGQAVILPTGCSSDGVTSQSCGLVHTYTSAGTYTATLVTAATCAPLAGGGCGVQQALLGTVTITVTGNSSTQPFISVQSISRLTAAIQYANLPFGTALEVFYQQATGTPIRVQGFSNTAPTSGTTDLSLPDNTQDGQYYVVAVDASGNAVEAQDASGNMYPVSAWFTETAR